MVKPEVIRLGVECTHATSNFICIFGCLDKHGNPKGYQTQEKLEKHYRDKHDLFVGATS